MVGNKARGGRALRIVVGITALVLLLVGGAGAVSWNKLWNSSDIGSISSIAVDDVDGDGTNEIVAGTLNNVDSSVYPYTYHGYVYIFNALTHELEWQSSDIGYVYNIAVADLDGDSRKEIIAKVKYGQSATIGYRYGFIYVFDGATHEQKWKSQDIGSYGDLAIEDLDGDGIKEIIASGDYYYSCTRYGNVYVFDGASFTQKWKSGNIPRAHEIVVADADDDGVKEIVVGNFVNDCEYYIPGYIFVFNGIDFTQEWISDKIGNVNSIVVNDLDDDGTKELIAHVTSESGVGGHIYVFDGRTHAQEWKSSLMEGGRTVKVNDVDDDGTKDIISRTQRGYVYIFNGKTYAQEWKSTNIGDSSELIVEDIDNDNVKEILTSDTSNIGNLLIFNGITRETKWQSEDIGTGALTVGDIDNDGWKEIVAGGGKQQHHGNLYIFGLASPPENRPPNPPINLAQFKSDGTEIPEGGTTGESTVIFKGTVSDPDGDNVRLEIELRKKDEPFTGDPTPETISDFTWTKTICRSNNGYTPICDFAANGTEVSVARYGLVDGDYKWQYRAKDSKGGESNWAEFKTLGNVDFSINQPPTCRIELRKDGANVNEIDVGESFDIVFTDYSGDIEEVRFASDESQDNVPPPNELGKWDPEVLIQPVGDLTLVIPQYYAWNDFTKTKQWSFATDGSKEVWAEVKDDAGQTANCAANIYAKPWSFAIITDLHIGRGYPDYGGAGYEDAGTDGQNYYLTERLKNVVTWINDNKANYNIKFVAVLGDFSDSGEPSELEKAKDILDNLDVDVPYVPVIGNHDVLPYTLSLTVDKSFLSGMSSFLAGKSI